MLYVANTQCSRENQPLKPSPKAALLSMLVFPGIGHLYLKQLVVGAVPSIGAASATYFIISNAVKSAIDMADKIQDGSIALGSATISELLAQQSLADAHLTNVAMIVLIAFWIIVIFDLYSLGRTLEKNGRCNGGRK